MLPRAILVLILLALSVNASAQGERSGPDLVIELDASGPAPQGNAALELAVWEPGERITWNITTTDELLVLEIRATGFAIERPRQLVPTLDVGEPYPLFEHVSYPDIWTAEDAVRLAHAFQSGETTILRLAVPGPANGTLTLTRDATPPTITPAPRTDATHFSFYQESRTDELAIVNLQVRERGAQAWIDNPTTVYHFLQRFPIQGLDADTEYETRFVATDWAGNEAELDGGPHRTLSAPVRGTLDIVPISPLPDSTIRDPNATIVAAFPNGTLLQDDGVRFFLDKRELRENLKVEGNRIEHNPSAPLAPGPHSVSIEVTSQDGSHGVARWIFHVRTSDVTGAELGIMVLALAALALARRR